MAKKVSAGLLPFRRAGEELQIFIVHPGGPFWKHKDEGAWSLPKGEYEQGEDALEVAKREFEEETGLAPRGNFIALGSVEQPGGKEIHAWAFKGDFDAESIVSNTFLLEWPRGSGTRLEYPEVDRAGWFTMAEARRKLLKGQVPFLDRLMVALDRQGSLR